MDNDTKKVFIYGCFNFFIWFMIITFCLAFWITLGSLIYTAITKGLC